MKTERMRERVSEMGDRIIECSRARACTIRV